jgi:predicted branched-subunit amino acid permease
MMIPLWRGPRRGIGWAVAGLVGLAASYLVPGWWFIVIGAVTGAVLGGLLDDRD